MKDENGQIKQRLIFMEYLPDGSKEKEWWVYIKTNLNKIYQRGYAQGKILKFNDCEEACENFQKPIDEWNSDPNKLFPGHYLYVALYYRGEYQNYWEDELEDSIY